MLMATATDWRRRTGASMGRAAMDVQDPPISDTASSVDALSGTSETLLITLAGRARGSRDGLVAGFSDPEAVALCRQFHVDLKRYAAHRGTVRGVVLRGAWFDARCVDFLTRCPDGVVLNLGAGLNTAYERVRARVPDGTWRWIDTDLAPVTDIRHQLFANDARRTQCALDATQAVAVRALLAETATPVLVLAEGVIMYLPQADVETLFAVLAERDGCEFVFDWMSPLGMRRSRRHPAVKRIKDESVVFRSSFKRTTDIQRINPRWRVLAETDAPVARAGLGPAIMGSVYRALTGGRKFYVCAHARVG